MLNYNEEHAFDKNFMSYNEIKQEGESLKEINCFA